MIRGIEAFRADVLPEPEAGMDADEAAEDAPIVLEGSARAFPDNAALEDWRRSHER